MGIRTSVTCNRCSHQWRTKAKNPDEAKCPKCAEAERGQRPITPAQAAKAVKQVISMRPARGVLISDGPSYAAERQVAEKFRSARPAPGPRDTRREEDPQRLALEAHLLKTGWRQLYPGPGWLDRWDRVYEKDGQRILSDDVGVFTYKLHGQQVKPFWQRWKGVVGWDHGRVLNAFDKPSYLAALR